MRKYNLNYKIEIDGYDKRTYTIQSFNEITNIAGSFADKLESPAVKINIEKDNTNSASSCRVELYNLAPDTQRNIRKSRIPADELRNINIYAGYEGEITLIFSGNVLTAKTNRNGSDMITVVEATDNYAMINSTTNISIAANVAPAEVLQTLANDLQGIKPAYITPEAEITKVGQRGRTYNGNTWEIINELNNNNLDIFIDNGELFIMGERQVRTADHLIIDAESGLLEEPEEYDGYLEIKTLFEPLANINNRITLNTTVLPEYNGEYKLLGLTHTLDIQKIGNSNEGITIMRLLFLPTQVEEIAR